MLAWAQRCSNIMNKVSSSHSKTWPSDIRIRLIFQVGQEPLQRRQFQLQQQATQHQHLGNRTIPPFFLLNLIGFWESHVLAILLSIRAIMKQNWAIMLKLPSSLASMRLVSASIQPSVKTLELRLILQQQLSALSAVKVSAFLVLPTTPV